MVKVGGVIIAANIIGAAIFILAERRRRARLRISRRLQKRGPKRLCCEGFYYL
jgi:hypothetical protein